MLAALMAGLLLSTAPGDVEQARADFERGADLYRAGDYRGALAAFQAAQARAPAPQSLFNIARCQERLGQLAEAVESYEAYLSAAPAAPARAAVSDHLAELQARLPLEASPVSVEPPASVSVDGDRPADLGRSQLGPGRHQVRAAEDGYQPGRAGGGPGRGRPHPARAVAGPRSQTSGRAPEAAVKDTGSAPKAAPRRWTYVAAGVAAVCLAAGIGFGASAQKVRTRCATAPRARSRSTDSRYRECTSAAANGFYAAAGIAGVAAVALFFEPHSAARGGALSWLLFRALPAVAVAPLAPACSLDLTGATCTNDNCPVRQFCSVA
jgi:hypothetical protein